MCGAISGAVRFKARQRAVEPPCRCGSGVGIYSFHFVKHSAIQCNLSVADILSLFTSLSEQHFVAFQNKLGQMLNAKIFVFI